MFANKNTNLYEMSRELMKNFSEGISRRLIKGQVLVQKKKFEKESKMFAKFFGIDDRMECYCNMYLQH